MPSTAYCDGSDSTKNGADDDSNYNGFPYKTALELLEPNPNRVLPALTKEWPYITGAIGGIGMILAANFAGKRPLISNLHYYAISGSFCCWLVGYVYDMRNSYYADRDAVYRHYVELHPEDFVIPKPKKLGELLENWVPVR